MRQRSVESSIDACPRTRPPASFLATTAVISSSTAFIQISVVASLTVTVMVSCPVKENVVRSGSRRRS
jgi:hypothetical protein